MMNPDPQTGSAGQQAQQTTDSFTNQVQNKSSEMLDKAQDTAKTTIDQQKGRAAGVLGSVADALHQTGQQLDQQNQGTVSQIFHQAANGLDQFSNDLQNKSVDDMLTDLESFARREPALFLGAATAVGILAARFFKSSGRRQYGRQGYSPYGYDRSLPGKSYTERDLADYRNQVMNNEYSRPAPSGYSTGYSPSGAATSGYSGMPTPEEPNPNADYPTESMSGLSDLDDEGPSYNPPQRLP